MGSASSRRGVASAHGEVEARALLELLWEEHPRVAQTMVQSGIDPSRAIIRSERLRAEPPATGVHSGGPCRRQNIG